VKVMKEGVVLRKVVFVLLLANGLACKMPSEELRSSLASGEERAGPLDFSELVSQHLDDIVLPGKEASASGCRVTFRKASIDGGKAHELVVFANIVGTSQQQGRAESFGTGFILQSEQVDKLFSPQGFSYVLKEPAPFERKVHFSERGTVLNFVQTRQDHNNFGRLATQHTDNFVVEFDREVTSPEEILGARVKRVELSRFFISRSGMWTAEFLPSNKTLTYRARCQGGFNQIPAQP